VAQVSGWLGAGLLTAGVSAAVLAGAGAASADTGGDSDAGTKGTSTVSADGTGAGTSRASTRTDDEGRSKDSADATPQGDESSVGTAAGDADADADAAAEAETPVATTTDTSNESAPTDESKGRKQRTTRTADDEPPSAHTDLPPAPTSAVTALPTAGENAAAAEPVDAAGGIGDILGPFQPDYPPVTRIVGSAVFNFIGALVQLVDGPPTVPQELRDSIRVGSSSLVISPGNEVPADWYFPTSGQPERLIYLQHGILASAPMYSHTAAYLAERTNSIVVATTLTSNPFADGGVWLGGDNMHKAVAQLFLDDSRAALNASFAAAAAKRGVSGLTVPVDFVLVGHSLGGGFGPGVAGHYAEGLVARRADGLDAPNRLAGVTLLDAVPFSPIMPNAMERLKALEESSSGDPADYIPVYEIGAPLNFLNSNSKVNQELSDARPGKFNGVVVDGGVHMDGMLGGNPLIQFSAYLVAGFPQPQNPPAVQLLMAGWINDMFDGAIDPTTGRCVADDCSGQYGDPGTTIVIPTDEGDASMVVIDSGALPAQKRLRAHPFTPSYASSTVWPPVLGQAISLQIAG
jgi:hypothetical protein